MSNKLEPKYLNLKQLSIFSGIPLSTLRRWGSERKYPLFKVSNRILVCKKEFEQWISDSRIEPRKGGNYEK